MSTGPYVIVCGQCNLPQEVHPHDHCPYYYKAILHPISKKLVGYSLNRKRKNGDQKKEHKKVVH